MKTTLYQSSKIAMAVLLLACVGCGGGSAVSSRKALAVGPWGSDSPPVQLTVTSTGGSIVDGTANFGGVIQQPITVNDSGHFSVTGTFDPLEGPPPPPGVTYTPTPARFSGATDGTTMTLTITVKPAGSSGYTEGPFTLTYDKVSIALP